MKHTELAARLDAAADRLTTRVLAEMYRDAFWHERFGDRADRHGRKDGRFHIDYLIQTLHADDPAIIENYARWLQQLLTARGMSTRHITENFERLAAAIRDEGWPDSGAAIAMLDAACAALHYPLGAARDIQRALPALVAAAADALPGGDRDSLVGGLTDLAIYATDAVALGQPAVFVSHAVWLAGFLERRGAARAQLVGWLEALAAAARLVPAAADELSRVISPAIAAALR